MDEVRVEEVLWTDSAKLTFNNIVEYLSKVWSEKEVKNFIDRVTEILEKIKSYPEICRPSAKRKNVRIAILNKHTKMVYHYMPRKKRIEILLFRNFKQNPANFNY